MTTIPSALKALAKESPPEEADTINLAFQTVRKRAQQQQTFPFSFTFLHSSSFPQKPPIVKLDAKSLGTLAQCRKLSLSTNAIEKMVPLTGMNKLKVLSLGRNNIKKIEKLDDVAESLEQLWISYNQITSLDGLASLSKLTTLYCSNNQIKAFSELDKLKSNEQLKDVLFLGK